MRLARNKQSRAEHRLGSAEICRQLITSGLLTSAKRIAGFWPTDGEPDIRPLLWRLSGQGRQCFLPGLLPFTTWPKQHRLGFASLNNPLQLNRYGIPEPTGKLVRLQSLDLLLAPLVAFNSQGQRLGRGRGYYDRTLACLERSFCRRKPKLAGIAFAFQQSEEIQVAPHDVAMDFIVTEAGCINAAGHVE